CVDPQRLFYADPLVGSPSLSVPSSPRDHSLDSHPRVKGSRAEVRARSCWDPCVEETPECHAAFHEVFAVKMKLVSVVVGVGREHRRNYAGSLDTPEQIVVNQCAMGDHWPSVRSWTQRLTLAQSKPIPPFLTTTCYRVSRLRA